MKLNPKAAAFWLTCAAICTCAAVSNPVHGTVCFAVLAFLILVFG